MKEGNPSCFVGFLQNHSHHTLIQVFNMDRSFSRNGPKKNNSCISEDEAGHDHNNNNDAFHLPSQLLHDVDGFLHTLHDTDADPLPQIPDSVSLLPKFVDSMIDKYNALRYRTKFGRCPEDDTSFLQALDRLCRLSNSFTHPSYTCYSSALHQTSSVLDRAMSFFDKELSTLLEDPKANHSDLLQFKTPKRINTWKSASFNSLHDYDHSVTSENDSPFDTPDQDDFPAFSPEAVSNINKMSTAMISAGYQTECCMAFTIFRRCAFKAAFQKFGYVMVNMEDVQRMQWESLEIQIATWINVVRHCSTVLFSAERRFYDSVFPDQPSISQSLFSDLARAVIIQFLNFAEAITLTKRSGEKLFRFLDMYETLRDLEPAVDDLYPEGCANELEHETATAKGRLGEAVAGTFCDLEESIKIDSERIPVPNGAVHPLTRYVMNYLEYACEYKDTLEQVFQQRLHSNSKSNESTVQVAQGKTDDGTPKNSPFSVELMTVMDLLDANLETKSRLYKNQALRYIFLMNNGRYIVQKVKGSAEIHECMGDNWCRKRQSALKGYHKNYQRETWSKVLHTLSHEGLQGNGKVLKPVLKERFKTFNAMFDEIHKTQSSWVVCDEQLQSELRVSVSAVMIPAYRSFLARFKHYLQSEKYIKYQPEDIENLIDDLFDGNATSMARRRF